NVEDGPVITEKNAAAHEGLSGSIICVFGDGTTSQGKMTGHHRASRRTQPADGTTTEGNVTDRRSTHGRISHGHSPKCKQTYPESAESEQPNRKSAHAYASHGNSARRK